MKCVCIGGSGFIGSFVARELSKEGNEVILYDIANPNFTLPKNIRWIYGDIRDLSSIIAVTKDAEEVYSFAGVLGTSELNTYPIHAIDVNILGCTKVLEACKINNVARVYNVAKPTFSGNHYENMYSVTKHCESIIAFFYQQHYNMNIAITRYYNASGPEQHLIPIRKFLPLISILAYRNMDIEIYGTGQQTMDIIDVRDVASTTILATRNTNISTKPVIYDNGTGYDVTCLKVAQDVINIVGSHSNIKLIPMRDGEIINSNIKSENHSTLHEILNYKLKYSYEKCLKDLVNYYVKMCIYDPDKVDQALDYFKKRDNLK